MFHHQYPKSQPSSVGIFLPVPPVLARFSGLASRAPPLRSRRFRPRRRLSVLRFLWWPRERSRGHFLCWRGFRGGGLWLATPVAVATECRAAAKKTARRRLLALGATRSPGWREHAHLVAPAVWPGSAHHLFQHGIGRAHQPFHDWSYPFFTDSCRIKQATHILE